MCCDPFFEESKESSGKKSNVLYVEYLGLVCSPHCQFYFERHCCVLICGLLSNRRSFFDVDELNSFHYQITQFCQKQRSNSRWLSLIFILFWEYIMYTVLCGVCLKQGYSPPPLTNILPGDFWPRRICIIWHPLSAQKIMIFFCFGPNCNSKPTLSKMRRKKLTSFAIFTENHRRTWCLWIKTQPQDNNRSQCWGEDWFFQRHSSVWDNRTFVGLELILG